MIVAPPRSHQFGMSMPYADENPVHKLCKTASSRGSSGCIWVALQCLQSLLTSHRSRRSLHLSIEVCQTPAVGRQLYMLM